jgi:hypothetical protein
MSEHLNQKKLKHFFKYLGSHDSTIGLQLWIPTFFKLGSWNFVYKAKSMYLSDGVRKQAKNTFYIRLIGGVNINHPIQIGLTYNP